MNDDNENKTEIPASNWATLHYLVGLLCLIVFVAALSESDGEAALISLASSVGCFIFGTILQSLKTICFYLREIYKRLDLSDLNDTLKQQAIQRPIQTAPIQQAPNQQAPNKPQANLNIYDPKVESE